MRITGTIARVVRSPRLTRNGWCIFQFVPDVPLPEIPDAEIKVTGVFPDAVEDLPVQIEGHVQEHEKYGRQIKARSIVGKPLTANAGLARLLHGLDHGLAPAEAGRLVRFFGDERLSRILDSGDSVQLTQAHLPADQAKRLARRWQIFRRIDAAMRRCCELGLSADDADALIDYYGATPALNQAIQTIQTNPYSLAPVLGLRFAQYEYMARRFGVAGRQQERIDAAIQGLFMHAIDEGHCYLERDYIIEQVLALCNRDQPPESQINRLHVAPRIEQMRLDDTFRTFALDGDTMFSPAEIHDAELSAAQDLKRLQSAPAAVAPDPERVAAACTDFTPTKPQQAAIAMVQHAKVALLTGDPGTGKTAITRVMLDSLPPDADIRLLAPTGQAADRLSESAGRRAHTIHNALGLKSDRDDPTPDALAGADCVVIDEASMVDIRLLRQTLSAVPDSARLLIIGDPQQLPSIGPGSVLRDLLQTPLPHTHLDAIVRQKADSGIIEAARRITEGFSPFRHQWVAADCMPVPTKNIGETADRVLAAVESLRERGLPPDNIQVLVPMRYTECGTIQLNRALRPLLNPQAGTHDTTEGAAIRDSDAVVGDRVRHLKNDYRLGIFNGEIGTVTAVDRQQGSVRVQFPRGETTFFRDTARQLQLDYATTIHRSQGSQYPTTIIGLAKEHDNMLDRRLLYTAFTRAQHLVMAVGPSSVYRAAAERSPHDTRQTRLADQINAHLKVPKALPAPKEKEPAHGLTA